MNDSFDTGMDIGFSFLLMLVCIAVAMDSPKISYGLVQEAEKVCSVNGGLKQIEVDAIWHDIYCVNGGVFEIRDPNRWRAFEERSDEHE